MEIIRGQTVKPHRTILRDFFKLSRKKTDFQRLDEKKVAPLLHKGSIALITWSISSKAHAFSLCSGSEILGNVTSVGMEMHKEWFTPGDVKLAQRLSLEELQGAGNFLVLDYLEIRQPGSQMR